jgi:hypothetical protein
LRRQFLDARLGNVPFGNIGLVEQAQKRDVADLGTHALPDRPRDFERLRTRDVDDQQIARRTAQVARAHRRDIVLAGDVPDEQTDGGSGHVNGSLVDLHTDRGQIGVGEYAVDEAPRQAGLADAEGAQQADLFLQHDSVTRWC